MRSMNTKLEAAPALGTLPFLQPAEIQLMYICQKYLVGCIFDSKMEFAVIDTSNTGIFATMLTNIHLDVILPVVKMTCTPALD